MSSRPRVTAELAARVAADAPGRLVRKLDREPGKADGWDWREAGGVWTIDTGGEARVTLRPAAGLVGDLEQAGCSCLLAPRCLHLLAVISVLEPVAGAPTAAAAEPSSDAVAHPIQPTAEQQAAASAAWDAGAQLLACGATAASTVLQADLLRAVHACRLAGLHRAAAAGLRVVRGVRDLRSEAVGFRLGRYAADVRELLAISWTVARQATVAVASLGTARRAYRPLGSLRVIGLFSEPVIAATGYAGVVTTLCDGRGRIWSLADVMPGPPERARAAYGAGVKVGDASLSHRQLARQGLFMQAATGSDDGRLGAGARVEAVAAGPSAPPEALWQDPLEEQLARRATPRPDGLRHADQGLLFLDVVVLGAAGAALAVEHEGRLLRCLAPTDSRATCHLDNLQLLARAPGLPLRAIGRVRPDGPRTLDLLAVLPGVSEDPGPRLTLPGAWGDRCCMGLDALQGAYLDDLASAPCELGELATEADPDPIEPLRRRLERLALGGRGTVPSSALASLEREAAQLERRLMPEGARMLRMLAGAALSRGRGATGELRPAEPGAIAQAWLAADAYARAATATLRRLAW